MWIFGFLYQVIHQKRTCLLHCSVFSIAVSSPLQCLLHCSVFSIAVPTPLQCLLHCSVYSIAVSTPLQCLLHCSAFSIAVSSPLQCLFHYFHHSDTPIERALIGLSCVKVWADSSQPFQNYGWKCEHAKQRTVCVTCRIIEKQESEQKSAISHCKNYSQPRLIGGDLTLLLAC